MASLTGSNDPIAKAISVVIVNFELAKKRFQVGMQQRQGNQLAGRTLAALRTLPGKPVYPIRWASQKQRRAFFASRGFGGGVPHERKGTIAAAWDADFIASDEGGILAVSNPYEEAQYIYGPSTQPFHLDTGWPQLSDVADDAFREMEGVSVEAWYAAADPLQGLG